MSLPLASSGAVLTTTGHRRRVVVTFSVAPSPQCRFQSTRRSLSFATILFLTTSSFANPNCADAGPFDKYVKRKKLEPLESYVPAVLLSLDQFKDLQKSLGEDEPRYDVGRSLLRSGPAASLRINIRAMAQYADDYGKGKVATDAVDECLRALEDLDSLLLRATRKDTSASTKSMRGKLTVALAALDNLLETVPLDVLDKGKAIADAYRTPSYEQGPNELQIPDSEIKKLESLL